MGLKKRIAFFYILGVICLLCLGCNASRETATEDADKADAAEGAELVWNIKNSPLNNLPLVEDTRVYLQDRDTRVAHIYLTVKPMQDDKTGKIYTLGDLNSVQSFRNEEEPVVEIIFQEGTEDGPAKGYFGYGQKEPGGFMRVRGRSTRRAVQKSYKIRLYDKAGLWRGQEVINLNKHPFDSLRIRNKFCFDYFEKIPDIVSLRTQFVHLHVKDLSKAVPDETFVDYGLYTHVEQPNKRFLRSRGLDPNGHLYKPEFFEFFRYPEHLKSEDDADFSEERFEQILEIREGRNHDKLLKMLDDVNDYRLDINDVVDKHFNRDNYLTWLGANILFGNIDTRSQNYLLYSPQNAMTWYFFPWDYDGSMVLDAFHHGSMEPASQFGIANYWGNVLHKRFFKDPNNVKALNRKLEELQTIINEENTQALIDKYEGVVKTFLYRLPDIQHLPVEAKYIEKELYSLQKVIEQNIQKYYRTLEYPMPIFLGEMHREGSQYVFEWERAYDLQGDDITYDFEIGKDPNFSQTVYSQKGLVHTRYTVENLTAGEYYWRVIVQDEEGNRQLPFDVYRDPLGNEHFGVKAVVVK